ncbi:MAG: Rid family hydrolase [Planctomycetota bacterium]
MASLLTPKRECLRCRRSDGLCNGEVVVVTTSQSREAFIRCAPTIENGTAREQALKFYGCLPRLLEEARFELGDVILERVFFRDIEADFETLRELRSEAYGAAGMTGSDLPAASYVHQPPCVRGQAFEFQLQAVAPSENGNVRIESLAEVEPRTTRKVVRIGDHRHLYACNINGARADETFASDFREESDWMFAKSIPILADHAADFKHVLRTWCYLDEIDRDYAKFNLSRNAFFSRHDIQRLPASTGIRAGLYPPEARCSFDLYALLNPDGADIEVMHTPTLNEADEYGSAFSRGMKVSLPEKTVLFISGTASVDEKGDTVHVNDVPKQIERMLLNVRELLQPHNSTFANMVQVITYLKHADYFSTFQAIARKWGLDGVPNTIVEAGVCRPDLLCELEAIAIIPKV